MGTAPKYTLTEMQAMARLLGGAQPVPCVTCSGTGRSSIFFGWVECSHCAGYGYTYIGPRLCEALGISFHKMHVERK